MRDFAGIEPFDNRSADTLLKLLLAGRVTRKLPGTVVHGLAHRGKGVRQLRKLLQRFAFRQALESDGSQRAHRMQRIGRASCRERV